MKGQVNCFKINDKSCKLPFSLYQSINSTLKDKDFIMTFILFTTALLRVALAKAQRVQG